MVIDLYIDKTIFKTHYINSFIPHPDDRVVAFGNVMDYPNSFADMDYISLHILQNPKDVKLEHLDMEKEIPKTNFKEYNIIFK